MDKKNVVILGAGFGGLKTAFHVSKELRRLHLLDRYQVIIVDRSEHHTFAPLLYEVATTSKETANLIHLHNLVTHNIPELIARYPISFIQDEVEKIQPTQGSIQLKKYGSLKADYLVLALGSETNYFGIPGLQEYSLTLKTFLDAIKIRDKILELADTKSIIEIAIGGGGPTGIELSAELATWCSRTLNCQLRITIIEAQPKILSVFSPRLAKLAEKRLQKLGVFIKTNAKIKKLTPQEIELENGKSLPYDLFVWGGGVKTPSILLNLPLKTEARGRIEASERMTCLPQTPNLELGCMVYGIGDNVCSYHPRTKKPVPAVAPAALAQATIATHNLIENIKKTEGLPQTIHQIYIPREYPYVIPVGGKYALAKVGPIILAGFLGWTFKGIVELYYLASIMPKRRALKIWLQGLRIFIQNDRLG